MADRECSKAEERIFPEDAAEWKHVHCEKLRIYYEGTGEEAEDIISSLKDRVSKRCLNELPEIGKKLLQFTQEVLNFSLNIDESPLTVDKDALFVEKSKFFQQLQSFRTIESSLFSKLQSEGMAEEDNCRLFYRWSAAVSDFLNAVQLYLVRWRSEETCTYTEGIKEIFVHLTRVCLMIPDSGSCFRKSMHVKEEKLTGSPDVRYPYISHQDPNSVVAIAFFAKEDEYDKYDMSFAEYSVYDRDFTPSIWKIYLSEILGKNAAQLLLEMKDSFFTPRVVGMLCFGTQLIFSSLEIDEYHLKEILTNYHDDEPHHRMFDSFITYSKPLDFMDAVERETILPLLFWLGHVQSFGYKNI